jgi:hypothetical protein
MARAGAAFGKAASSYNRSNPIPGVSGRRVPGNIRMPKAQLNGGAYTNVPHLESGSAMFREYHRQQIRDASGRFAGGWGFAWQGLESVDANLYAYVDSTLENMRAGVERLKDEMVAWAKENAPWEDRTTDARNGLQGHVVWTDKEHFTIFLGHGPDIYYGIWLEVRWGGKFAIILPTIQHFAPMIGERIATQT